MVRTTPEVYAAFRAECLKADIEMDSAAHRRAYRKGISEEMKKVEAKEYMRKWNKAHREEIRIKQNARYAKKKLEEFQNG